MTGPVEVSEAAGPPPLILVFVPHMLEQRSRSGVQRLVVSSVTELAELAEIDLVTWDGVDGQMRYYDDSEMASFFRGSRRPSRLRVQPSAQSIGRRFQDMVPAGRDVWMVFPEIFYHLVDGAQIGQRVITQCLEAGWRTAAILYDLIPILNADYAAMRHQHEQYAAQLLRCDLILAISHHVETVFRGFLAEHLGLAEADLAAAGTVIGTVVLPGVEAPVAADVTAGAEPVRDRILLLGTVEPRKRQTVVLRCYKELLAAGEMPLKLQVIGSLHGDVADEFHALLADEPGIIYEGYMPDAAVEKAFARSQFTVFASADEGFGLPITESLSRGIPCLTANFGAMAEVAAGGGCLTVDVMDPSEIRRGMHALATDAWLLRELREQIARRVPRSWGDYARELLELLAPVDPGFGAGVAACLAARADVPAGAFGAGSPAVVFGAGAVSVPGGLPALRVAAVAPGGVVTGELAGADVLLLPGAEPLDALVAEVERRPELGALPGWIETSADAAKEAALLAAAIRARTRLGLVALRERNFGRALAGMGMPFARRMLSIVISTYNRAQFVAANAAWIVQQLAELGPAVELVVVDNCSKDDSEARLAPFRGVAGVRIVVNPTNVGMLGNLKVCASLMLAEHVWLIGDDDFIMPGVLHDILRVISVNPAVPLVLLNFGVYHRSAMAPGDSAAMFVSERALLAPDAAPSGPMRVIDAGSHHDNMFTAIYPIVFRADIAAAVFNHYFRGAPFRSLTESVPTTRFILECYALTEAYWITDTCIVGNAHNSWQHYRVAWHAVLMPLVFRLARRAGMDPLLMRRWAQVHVELYEDARRLFPAGGIAAEFDADALAASYEVLRQRLPLAEPAA